MLAENLAALNAAQSICNLSIGLVSLGLGDELLVDIEKLFRSLAKHVLVMICGADSFWQKESPPALSRGLPQLCQEKACQTLPTPMCAFCQELCFFASCEHTHAAFLHLGLDL